MSNKKYQVFVSSTFLDLKEERQAVQRATLNLGHIPAGMELFPASNTDQLSYIKKVIDDCDYYILILGGRYGSTTEEGLSYTELEYQYAVEKNKPILAFLHADIGEIPSKNVDIDKRLKEKLNSFRLWAQSNRVVEFWNSVEDLQAKFLVSLTKEISDNPQTGWQRETNELNQESLDRLNTAQKMIDHYRKRLTAESLKVRQYENLDSAQIEIRFNLRDGPSSIKISGRETIQEFGASLMDGLSDENIAIGLKELITHRCDGFLDSIEKSSIRKIKMFFEVFEIAEPDKTGLLTINVGKHWLLKAAFLPFRNLADDEIPF